jgi:prepilin-type N-terminal cleavage/methylation domain-containing protein
LKLRGFTIVEVLVGLLIGSIVIVLAVISFAQIQKMHLRFEESNLQSASYKRLFYLLDRDVCTSQRILTAGIGDNFCVVNAISNGGASIVDTAYYRFDEMHIYREEHGRVDTFLFEMSSVELQNWGNNQSLITYVKIHSDKGDWTFNKQYGGDILLFDELKYRAIGNRY